MADATQATQRNGNTSRLAVLLIAVAATMFLLQWAQEVFVPIVLAVFISYALEPIVAALARLRLPRPLAAGMVVATLAGGAGYGGYTLSDDVAAIVAELPAAATKLRQALRQEREGPGAFDSVQRAARELQRTADENAGTNPAPRGVQRVQIEEPAVDLREYLSWGSAGVVAFASQALLVVFFVFFLLASGDLFKRKLVKLAGPSLEKKKVTVQILDEINAQIARFLFVHALTSSLVGLASWGAFTALGIEQAGLWAIAAGVFNSIPYFGPVLVATGIAVVAFVQFGTLSMVLYVSAVSLAITSLEGWLLTPWLTSRATRTNEIAVFVGLIVWSFLWGIWGTLLAVPILVAVKACCDRIDDLKPVGELLGA